MTGKGDVPRRVVFDGDWLRAEIFGEDSRRLFVTFDHRQVGKRDFIPADPVKRVVEAGWANLKIMSRRNDWFINAETAELERSLAAVASGFSRVNGLGYSMGGYGVFRFAKCLNMSSAIAVSPQMSVSPKTVPWDSRFYEDAPDFDQKLGDLSSRAHDGLNALILIDSFHRKDLRHAKEIAALFPESSLLKLGFSGHPATRVINRGRRSGILLRQAMNNRPDPAPIRKAFRETRVKSPAYWKALARKAEGKHDAIFRHAMKELSLLQPKSGVLSLFGRK